MPNCLMPVVLETEASTITSIVNTLAPPATSPRFIHVSVVYPALGVFRFTVGDGPLVVVTYVKPGFSTIETLPGAAPTPVAGLAPVLTMLTKSGCVPFWGKVVGV